MDRKYDLGILLGIFSSSVAIWYYLYKLIIEKTYYEPASVSLIYLGVIHFVSFLCVLFSFILLIDYSYSSLIFDTNTFAANRLEKIAKYSRMYLFALWAPMLIFCIVSMVAINAFTNSDSRFWNEFGGFLISLVVTIILFYLIIGKAIFKGFANLPKVHFFIPSLFIGIFFHAIILSFYSANIKFSIEKEFYKEDEVVRFSVERQGYIALPQINHVLYNFSDTLHSFSEETYCIDLKKWIGFENSVIEITYTPQVFCIPQKRYFYVRKTPQ